MKVNPYESPREPSELAIEIDDTWKAQDPLTPGCSAAKSFRLAFTGIVAGLGNVAWAMIQWDSWNYLGVGISLCIACVLFGLAALDARIGWSRRSEFVSELLGTENI